MNRAQLVRAMATDLKIRAQIVALKPFADETAAVYQVLGDHFLPDETARGYFAVKMVAARLAEDTLPK